jgi:hypothetical protein
MTVNESYSMPFLNKNSISKNYQSTDRVRPNKEGATIGGSKLFTLSRNLNNTFNTDQTGDSNNPNYMVSFLQNLKQDKEFYDLFLAEAEKRGHYNTNKLRNQTLDFARKDYSDTLMEKCGNNRQQQ